MSGDGYQVDLSYLNATVLKLQGVAQQMDHPIGVATYQTNLSRSQIGGETFIEAGNLFAAHEHMKAELASMIATLQSMIQEFKDKTGHAHDQYANQETTTGTTMKRGMV
ncbi:hypothetical protein [Streptacidiphilus rugosus]|uniref:hypothetical protein n=1 Tax=Streptacidiphilus rugosus TaxID=405783 RepID=UPI00056AB5CD|nr:hypothetical protein [Streptacidiphilus rugosus]